MKKGFVYTIYFYPATKNSMIKKRLYCIYLELNKFIIENSDYCNISVLVYLLKTENNLKLLKIYFRLIIIF